MSLGQRIRKGAVWLSAGRVVSRLTEFLFGVALARILVPADFGLLVTVQIFTGLAGFVAGGGMGLALVQAKVVEKQHFHVVFTLQLAICIGLYLLFFVAAPWIAVLFDNSLYTDLLRVSALTFLVRPFVNVPLSILKREYRFKRIALMRVVSIVGSGTASVLLALQGYGVWALVIGGLIGPFCGLPVLYHATRWCPRLHFERESARRLGGYGFRSSINDILFYAKSQLPNLVISHQLGPAPLGLYNKGDSLSQIPLQIIGAPVSQTVFRGMSEVQDNKDLSKYMYLRMTTLLSAYVFPIFVVMYWTASAFLAVVYGEKWLPAAEPLQILVLAGFMRCAMRPAGQLLAAQDRLGSEIRIQVESILLIAAGVLWWVGDGIAAVAWVIVAGHVYTLLRLNHAAQACVSTTHLEWMQALFPALAMNLALFGLLWGMDAVLMAQQIGRTSFAYLAIMACSGVIVYVITFLYLPIPALANEAARIKRLVLHRSRG